MDRADIAALMDAETWITADDAVSQGFADSIEEKATKAKNAWDLTAYAKAPQPSVETVEEFVENQTKEHDAAARERELRLLDTTAA
jgi:hypothetical protein